MDATARGPAHIEGMDTHFAVATRRWVPPHAERRVGSAPFSPVLAPTAVADAEFRRLCQGLEPSGGLVSADLLAGLMRHGDGTSVSQPISQVARWIVGRQIVCVPWRSQTLLPVFQFGAGMASLRPGLAAVMAELTDVFDDGELALWFALGNCSLGGAAPADCLATQAADVWQAARTDRFIATGG